MRKRILHAIFVTFLLIILFNLRCGLFEPVTGTCEIGVSTYHGLTREECRDKAHDMDMAWGWSWTAD